MGCSPTPAYSNPVPWVDILPPTSTKGEVTTTRQTDRNTFMSPPMLWKEVENRDVCDRKPKTKSKREVKKHSCIDKESVS